jgi:hypothetical protein
MKGIKRINRDYQKVFNPFHLLHPCKFPLLSFPFSADCCKIIVLILNGKINYVRQRTITTD